MCTRCFAYSRHHRDLHSQRFVYPGFNPWSAEWTFPVLVFSWRQFPSSLRWRVASCRVAGSLPILWKKVLTGCNSISLCIHREFSIVTVHLHNRRCTLPNLGDITSCFVALKQEAWSNSSKTSVFPPSSLFPPRMILFCPSALHAHSHQDVFYLEQINELVTESDLWLFLSEDH